MQGVNRDVNWSQKLPFNELVHQDAQICTTIILKQNIYHMEYNCSSPLGVGEQGAEPRMAVAEVSALAAVLSEQL